MPVYEYVCNACGVAFEHLAKSMTSQVRPPCPECESKDVVRQHSAFAAHQAARPSSPPPGPCGQCTAESCPGRMMP